MPDRNSDEFKREVAAFRRAIPNRPHSHLLKHYVLDGREPVEVDFAEWAIWYEAASRDGSRFLANNEFGHEGIGHIRVSTLFMGMGGGIIIEMFETMIFGGGEGLDHWQARASTYDEAMANHRLAVELVKNAFQELAKVHGA